jgi:hypothetical protein
MRIGFHMFLVSVPPDGCGGTSPQRQQERQYGRLCLYQPGTATLWTILLEAEA